MAMLISSENNIALLRDLNKLSKVWVEMKTSDATDVIFYTSADADADLRF